VSVVEQPEEPTLVVLPPEKLSVAPVLSQVSKS
jgi:hypothetical protein